MSAVNFYLKRGYPPINKNVIISGPDTIAIWTPVTGNKVVLTDITITANQKGTMVIFLYDQQLDGINRVAAFSMGASGTIVPAIECIQGTANSGVIYARTTGNTTNGWNLNLTGFEI